MVTSILDGKKSVVRAACIDAVHDYGEECQDFGKKPAHRQICYGGGSIDVSESLEEICEMIYGAEL